MKVTIEIELGDNAMQTGRDVADAVGRLSSLVDKKELLTRRDGGSIFDRNGHRIGSWKVV